VFPSNKGLAKESNIDYTQLLNVQLSRLVRRKSCVCHQCGGKVKALQAASDKEILNEPLYPFIKSLQEIEYEKRLKKKQKVKTFKRMKLEVFKEELKGRNLWPGTREFGEMAEEARNQQQ